MTTWASLGERIEELERQVHTLRRIRRNHLETIKALRADNDILRGGLTRDEEHDRIAEQERQIADQRIIITNQLTEIKALHREVAILSEYKRAVLILADAWDALCVLFGDRGT